MDNIEGWALLIWFEFKAVSVWAESSQDRANELVKNTKMLIDGTYLFSCKSNWSQKFENEV